MSNEIDLDERPAKTSRPYFLTLAGLLTIGGLVALPFLAGEPDGGKMPDMVRFLGRFHPVILHLPIGIFVLILCQEFVAMFTGKTQRSILPAFLGAASAVLAMLAGFLLYQGGGFEGSELVEDHLWGGLGFACLAVLSFIAKAWSAGPGSSQAFYRVLVLSSVGVMTYASHNGGSITHGEDYLTKYAPDPIREAIGLEPKKPKQEAKPLEEQIAYADIVHPILEKRCVQCHKEGKSKGKFRMDTYELLLAGGKEGDGLEPGNADDSNIVYRIELPEDDEEHMPPDGKEGLDDNELAVLKWWINEGADPVKTVAELNLTDEIRAAIAKIVPSAATSGDAPTAAKADTASADLVAMVAKLSEEFPGGLTFESQSSANLTFTGVSLRKNLTDELFEKLAPVLPKMVSVDLSASSVTDASVALLAGSPDLKLIRLAETGITDASIDTLVKLQNLESVNLYGTKVTDEGVKKLAALKNLRSLYLWQTAVTPAAIAELQKALPDAQIITGI
ncbi:hypothetical protein HZ994_12625 [Akkermansiaceae bacterium]|nr:hypothetical protein HZ994_12625 [Akkermansiaceae bacterium]